MSTKQELILSDADEVLNKFSLKNRVIRWGNTVYLDEYPALLIEFMVAEKGSLTAFCAVVGCSTTTMDRWMERHEALREAYEVAKGYRSWQYEKLLHDCAAGTIRGNFSAIKFGLMNYNGDDFKEKHEVEHTGNVVFSIDSGIPRPGDVGFTPNDKNYIEHKNEGFEDADTINVEAKPPKKRRRL